MRQDLRRLVLQESERLVQRAHGDAADLHRVELLEAVERARHDGVAQCGDRARGAPAAVRAGDVDVLELVGIEPVDALDLRDHLVAAAGDVEAVDEIAAEHRTDVGADLLQVETEVGDLVAVDDELGLRLVDLDVDDRREGEHAALHRLRLELLGELEDLFLARPSRRG